MKSFHQRPFRLEVEALEDRALLSVTGAAFSVRDPIERNSGNVPAAAMVGLDVIQQNAEYSDLKGKGYAVVVIDTGVDLNHPFFGPDADANGVADRIVYQWDFANNDADAGDRDGHGSHVTSLLASQDAIVTGVTPEVSLIVLKVFTDQGAGRFGDIEKALRWVTLHAAEYNVAAVNLSLGDGKNWTGPTQQYALSDELAALAAQNIVVVAAAGNAYARYDRNPGVAYPAADANVIAVGAVWAGDFGGPLVSAGATDTTTAADRVAAYGQRSAVLTGILAPGGFFTGANATGGTQQMLGTSQAAPFVSGAAVLAQQAAEERLGRRLTPTEFRLLIQHTGVPVIDGDDEQDSVRNTGATFRRLHIKNLIDTIRRLPADWNEAQPIPLTANQAPQLARNETLTLSEGGAAAVTAAQLQALDVEDGAGELRFTLLRKPAHGAVLLNNRVLQPNATFTQADIDAGRVRYRHNGSETTGDSFTFTLSDADDSTSGEITFTLTITPRNDAPVLTDIHLTVSSATVENLVGSVIHDADVDAVKGIAVLGTTGVGTWQFSLDNGKTWRSVNAVSPRSGLLLRAHDQLRFVAANGWSGTATITYRAWDQTNGRAGEYATFRGGLGGTSAFSMTTATASLLVHGANRAPMLERQGMVNIAAGTQGSSVTALLGTSLTDPDGTTAQGIAVVGLGNALDGTWQYSLDNGTTWKNFGAVYRSRGRLLTAGNRVRFLPKTSFTGVAKLTFHGWDQTRGNVGGTVNLLSPNALGGSTAFSVQSQIATWSR